jgi:hypothetical protein
MTSRIAALAVALLLLTGCAAKAATGKWTDPSPTPYKLTLEDIHEVCLLEDADAQVKDDGKTLIIDGKGEEDATGAALTAIGCVIERVEMPDSVIAQMEQTRALDGMRSGSWEGYEATWNYHPDSGLNLIVVQR